MKTCKACKNQISEELMATEDFCIACYETAKDSYESKFENPK